MDAAVSSGAEGSHAGEVARGDRFEFGKNWAAFLASLTEQQIVAAEASLRRMLGVDTLAGKTFVDVGSGSGLFSLAARRLGARIHSFDYDPHSVACTQELRRRFFPADESWNIEEGSALDVEYLQKLGQFDVVYSWGVLHHTGSMWAALANVAGLAAPHGKLFIAIYNDQGSVSTRWRLVKRIYNRVPRPLKPFWAGIAIAPTEFKAATVAVVRGRFGGYLRGWTRPGPTRGMTHWRDIIDWVGGYPYEVASPGEIFDFYRARGFVMSKLMCKGVGSGCVEYVFDKPAAR